MVRVRRDRSFDGSAASYLLVFVALLVAPVNAHGQTQSSSRPLSGTVVGTSVVRNGELSLLVLWRGTPGWFDGSDKSGGGGGSSNGREFGHEWLTFGNRTLSIEFDYSARLAKLLGEDVSLVDTNVVLVDDVDRPGGPRIVARRRVDPSMPTIGGPRTTANDPAVIAIRRDPEAMTFLQCEIPPPVPAGVAAAALDEAARARVIDYVQRALTLVCREVTAP